MCPTLPGLVHRLFLTSLSFLAAQVHPAATRHVEAITLASALCVKQPRGFHAFHRILTSLHVQRRLGSRLKQSRAKQPEGLYSNTHKFETSWKEHRRKWRINVKVFEDMADLALVPTQSALTEPDDDMAPVGHVFNIHQTRFGMFRHEEAHRKSIQSNYRRMVR